MQNRSESGQTRRMFLLGAGLILAHQVAGKAVRDGLFLSRFSPARLAEDRGVRGAGLGAARAWVSRGSCRASARCGWCRRLSRSGRSCTWWNSHCCGPAATACARAVVTMVYLHLVGFGAILLSGFWSVANEVFDPREAKREFGRIAGAGTVGGICGGLLAERGAALFGGESLLVLLAVLHLAAWLALCERGGEEPVRGRCAGRRRTVAGRPRGIPAGAVPGEPRRAGPDRHRQRRRCWTTSSRAAPRRRTEKGPQLTRYFALFYTGSQVLTFAGADLPDAGRAAAAGPGPHHAVAFHRRGVRRGRVAVASAVRDGAGGARAGTDPPRIVPALQLRAVLHAGAAAGKTRHQDCSST